MIDKRGIHFAYNLGVIMLATSSLLLAFTPNIWLLAFISSGLFGFSYIYLTGVLLVWGIKIFAKNASLGIGIPFLLLAVGQVIGSSLAGIVIDTVNFQNTFIIFGITGYLALLLYPQIKVKAKPQPKGKYNKLQQSNKEILDYYEQHN